MTEITITELGQVAGKLEKLFKTFNIGVKVATPNIIALTIPKEIKFQDINAMKEFCYHSLKAAGIELYATLEFIFVSPNGLMSSIILSGTSKGSIN